MFNAVGAILATTSLVLAGMALLWGQTATAPLPGQLTERIACSSDPTQTYTAYLPSAYTAERRWPVLFVFDPRGRGTFAARIFQSAAERYGWIVVSSDNTRSDGPWEPNQRAVTAMWPDVLTRFSIDERRIHAAGFSGGATVAWVLAQHSRVLAGIISVGAPGQDSKSSTPITFALFGATGRRDFNFVHAADIARRVARAGKPQRIERFDGAHEWLPSPMAARALGWFEALAMKAEVVPRNADRAAGIRAADLEAARALEAAGRLTEAHDLYVAVVESLDGVVDVATAQDALRRLRADPRLEAARREESRAERAERARLQELGRALGSLYQQDLPSPNDVSRTLRLDTWQRAAQGPGPQAEAAQRTLETIFVQTSFYLWRDFEQHRDFDRAALSLEIASRIHPDRPRVWYDLAAARAMSGSRSAALEALERAIETGWRDRNRAETDDRFASLLDRKEFNALLDRMSR